jgi:hypothetical protein
MWNPRENSDYENMQYVRLRAIEWASWPIFVSQPIAPIALLFFPWWKVILFILIAGFFWALLIRDFLIVPMLAYVGSLIVYLKWLACPITAGILVFSGSPRIAVLALLWPLLASVMPLVIFPFKPPRLGDIEMRFMQSLGYEPALKDWCMAARQLRPNEQLKEGFVTWWPFKKTIEKRLIRSFETGLREIQVSLYMRLRSQYSATMAEEPAGLLAAQVVNYLKGEDIAAVIENSAEPLKTQIGRIKDHIPESAAKAMAESRSTREVVV